MLYNRRNLNTNLTNICVLPIHILVDILAADKILAVCPSFESGQFHSPIQRLA